MKFYYNMKRGEFIDWLRYSAIAGGMPPQFIDRVDELDAMEDLEAEIEKAGEKLAKVEEDCGDLFEQLQCLVNAIEDCAPELTSEDVKAAIKWANKALERHREYR